MKNKIAKSLGMLTLASLMTTTAFSQVTISGSAEMGYITGSNKAGNGGTLASTSKGLGTEHSITFATKGKLSNGWDYSAYQNIDSDETVNGRDLGSVNPMTTRAIELSPNADFKLFYTYDGVYGGEIARTAVPTVTERVADQTGISGLSEFIDVTSGGHAVGFDVLNVGPKGRLSVAYNPNLDAFGNQSSDRAYSASNQTALHTASGYSIGYSVTPGPVKIAAGYTKIDQYHNLTAQDPNSKTLGVTFTEGPFAIGAQRTKNEGVKKAMLTTASFEDRVDTFALAFAANKEITLGLDYSRMDRSGTAITTKGPDTKVYHGVVAYNLGPVVVSAMYEDAKNKANANLATVSGQDSAVTKIKVKANF